MAEIPDEALALLQKLAATLTTDDDPPDDEPDDENLTIGQLIAREVRGGISTLRQELGLGDDEGEDDEDDDEQPLEVELAALRHIFTTRFPQADLDAELARVSGLSLGDDGEVVGDAQYEMSNAVRSRVRGTTGRRRTNDNPSGGSTRRRSGQQSTKSIAEMTPSELAAYAAEQGDENAAQMFKAEAAREKAGSNSN